MSKLKNFDTKIWLVAVDHPGHFVLPCTKIVFPTEERGADREAETELREAIAGDL
jgi:hypothetical protein